ncbi:MAG: ribonuclease H [Acidimicrobiia bacterium]
MPEFSCRECGSSFTLPGSVLERYPGWTPRLCTACRGAETGGTGTGSPGVDDPSTGVFTDGSSVPNPGPGGWGAVYVIDGEVIAQISGADAETTNNRMELKALIEGASLVPDGTPATVYSDSNLAVRTINEWAPRWKQRGWKRKSGPVENLELVKQAYDIYRNRPELSLVWIRAHVGYTWNEYADTLANTARLRGI